MLIPKKRRGLLVIFILLAIAIWGMPDLSGFQKPVNPGADVVITSQAQKHILYGDNKGGGHKYGQGVPCKSEFPENWNNEKIMTTVEMVAANDNLDWEEQRNGYYVAEEMVDDIKVRVVLNRDRDGVVTAYPTNVKRNPCPVPANDNLNQ